MKKISYKVSSVTYAMKAKKLLSECGVSSYIQRNPNPKEKEGCGYRLIADEKYDGLITEKLTSANIPILAKEQA